MRQELNKYIAFLQADIKGSVTTIQGCLSDISTLLSNVDNTSALDRTMALLTQVSSTVNDAAQPQASSQPQMFIKTIHSPPAQKDETQLRFKQTSTKPGRKKSKASRK